VLCGSLLVEFAFKHSDILHEVTVIELHVTVEDCSVTFAWVYILQSMSVLSCSICVCEAVRDIRTDVELKKKSF